MARIPRNVVGALWWVRCSGRDLAGKKKCVHWPIGWIAAVVALGTCSEKVNCGDV